MAVLAGRRKCLSSFRFSPQALLETIDSFVWLGGLDVLVGRRVRLLSSGVTLRTCGCGCDAICGPPARFPKTDSEIDQNVHKGSLEASNLSARSVSRKATLVFNFFRELVWFYISWGRMLS